MKWNHERVLHLTQKIELKNQHVSTGHSIDHKSKPKDLTKGNNKSKNEHKNASLTH